MAEEKGFDFQSMSGEMLTTQAKVFVVDFM